MFALWPAGRWMGECLGPCKILGNLCGLWICVRIHCNFAVQIGAWQSPDGQLINWVIGQLANWASCVGQIGYLMDGRVAVWTLCCTLVKVTCSTLDSQQGLLTCAQVCGVCALLFGFWRLGCKSSNRLGNRWVGILVLAKLLAVDRGQGSM